MDKDVIIRVEGLGKRYRLGASNERYVALRDVLAQGARRLLRAGRRAAEAGTSAASTDFWALKDVSFEVRRGDVLGVIGRNGAGKSTLLKVLSRITEPTTGKVTLKGRVASLLEVGTDFHAELTGRENIFLNGAILGMHRSEIKAKFDEIVAFAEVEKFLDTPVKRYSSGMYVRLAFAVAAHLEPEILIVDEVLAVGDAEFQRKCLGKMHDVAAGEGRTVLFVSHQTNAMQTLCTRCLLLVNGHLQAVGAPSKIIGDYLRSGASTSLWVNSGREYENAYFKPTRFALVDRELQPLERDLQGDEEAGVLIEGTCFILDEALTLGFSLYTADGNLLYWSLQTDTAREYWPAFRLGENRFVCFLPRQFLNEGEYRVELHVSLHHRAWLCQPGVNTPSIYFKLRGGLSLSPHWMAARPGMLAPILPFSANI